MGSGDLDKRSEKIAHLPPAREMEELPNISALPRNFTPINSMHESEEIIEDDTRPPSVLSERRGTKKRKKTSTATIPSSRRKKSKAHAGTKYAFHPRKHGEVLKILFWS